MSKIKAFLWLLLFLVLAMLLQLLQVLIVPLSLIAVFIGKPVFRSPRFAQWGINCWEGEDNKASAQLGGDPDESISSRLGKARLKGSGFTFIADKVDLVAKEIFGDENHCNKSIEKEEGRKQVTTY